MIPAFLVSGCFWDCDPREISLQSHRRFIIERVMEYGNDEAIKWLLRTYTHEELADVLRYSRALTAKTATCWANCLGVSEGDVICIRKYCRQEDAPFFQP